jgi:Flp pilus assembly protein protease CpaA
MIEVIFLLSLAFIWIVFAVIQDLKSKEIANWLNFSLIIFALGFRFFYPFFNGNNTLQGFSFFYQGLLGLGIFFISGY